MTIQEIIKILTGAGIDPGEANIEVKMLIEHFCGFTRKDILLGKKLTDDMLDIVLEKAKLRAETRQPVQHIIGFADFMGEKFKVNPHVLIPRDETEFLVRKAVEIINTNNFKTALDMGTGSGCIACMTAKLTDCGVLGTDISNDALNTALDNASRLNLCNKAVFRKSDIFSDIRKDEKFDIIISNPPYIPISEKASVQKEVTFDPDLALYTQDEKGLEFYEKIIAQAPKFLNPNGCIVFEAGYGQADDIKKFLTDNGFCDIEIIKDLAGIDRVISAVLREV